LDNATIFPDVYKFHNLFFVSSNENSTPPFAINKNLKKLLN